MPNNQKRRVGAKSPNHIVITTQTVQRRLHHQCGRWSLRCTKSRKNRVSCSCVTAPKRKISLKSPDHSSLQTSKTQDKTSHSFKTKGFSHCDDDSLESSTCAGASTPFCTSTSAGASTPFYSKRAHSETVELPPHEYTKDNCMKILNTMDLPLAKLQKALERFNQMYWRQVFILLNLERRECWVNDLV